VEGYEQQFEDYGLAHENGQQQFTAHVLPPENEPTRHDMYGHYAAKYEMPGEPAKSAVVYAHAHEQPPVELPGDAVAPKA
jgi:hypothetical protein